MNEEVSTFDYEEENPKGSNRPAFLKVLCILSWISVALGVFGCLSNSLTPFSDSMDVLDDQISMMEEIDAPGLEDFGYFLQAKKDNFKLENTGNFILILIEGFAVYLMFMLKKIGYDTKRATNSKKKYEILLKVYQMHYRQRKISGKLDSETFKIIQSHFKHILTSL